MPARPRIVGFWLYQWAHTSSIGFTRQLVRRTNRSGRYVCVGGYPKSGTTWISQLVGQALGFRVPRDTLLPLLRGCVVHHHWGHEPALDRSIYVVRDGRDVMASEFVAMMNAAERLRERGARFGRLTSIERALVHRIGRNARLQQRFDRVFGRAFDPWDVERNFPRFVEENLREPFSEVADHPWHRHVEGWLRHGWETTVVRYEDMLADPQATLDAALRGATGRSVGSGALRAAVDRFSFERVSGRPRGTEDRSAFARKGVDGDWTNWFDRETGRRFDETAGDLLVSLGYAEDRRWFER